MTIKQLNIRVLNRANSYNDIHQEPEASRSSVRARVRTTIVFMLLLLLLLLLPLLLCNII